MSGITQIFLGIIIVGIIMTVKVIIDGFQSISALNERITTLRASTRHCETQRIAQDEENETLETAVKELKSEVEDLTQQEKEMNREINTLRIDLDGPKTNI